MISGGTGSPCEVPQHGAGGDGCDVEGAEIDAGQHACRARCVDRGGQAVDADDGRGPSGLLQRGQRPEGHDVVGGPDAVDLRMGLQQLGHCRPGRCFLQIADPRSHAARCPGIPPAPASAPRSGHARCGRPACRPALRPCRCHPAPGTARGRSSRPPRHRRSPRRSGPGTFIRLMNTATGMPAAANRATSSSIATSSVGLNRTRVRPRRQRLGHQCLLLADMVGRRRHIMHGPARRPRPRPGRRPAGRRHRPDSRGSW